jgi:hypothetical protein
MRQRPDPKVEQPRSEPEIIPPGDSRLRSDWRASSDGSRRIYVARIGPFGIALLAIGLGVVAASILLLFIGAFLVMLPFAGVFLAAAIIIGLLSGPFRRLR